jgi:transglutaminase-like putative cysteine protease
MSGSRRYRVTHETVYSYGGDVAHAHHLLHLAPRPRDHQFCLASEIRLDPAPSFRCDDHDAFGNPIARLEYDRPHSRLEVSARLDVIVEPRQHLDGAVTETWEQSAARLRYSGLPMDAPDVDAAKFKMQSSYVVLKQMFVDYGADCFPPGQQVLTGAEELMRKIHRDMRYVPGATDISTSVVQVFETRKGVCQDFAHLMIACLRSRGLAARYVSGYLRTHPDPRSGPDGALVGADASHAWVSAYCPPMGWVDLDPTNDVHVDTDHVTLAWGRDFGDVSPLRGVIVGGGGHDFSVRVSVVPIPID